MRELNDANDDDDNEKDEDYLLFIVNYFQKWKKEKSSSLQINQ